MSDRTGAGRRPATNFSQQTYDRSRSIYRFLASEVNAGRTNPVTYGQIAGMIGCHQRALRFPLHLIQDACRKQGIPTITVLVVRKDSGIPGQGCDANSKTTFDATRGQIGSHTWPVQAWW